MDTPLMTFQNIDKQYGANKVLQAVDLALYREKCILLLGNNGAGKSTLLKILAGLETPSRAVVDICGKLLSWEKAVRSIRKEIIYLHQQPYLFSGTVEANVAYGLRFTPLQRKQRKKIVSGALVWAGLTSVAKHQADTLSGGVRQRVAFTRAWILKPKILLLDEPLTNMDHDSREQACLLLRRMKTEGMSIVISSHDPHYFETLTDMRFRLTDGKLESRPPEI